MALFLMRYNFLGDSKVDRSHIIRGSPTFSEEIYSAHSGAKSTNRHSHLIAVSKIAGERMGAGQ